MLLGIPMGFWLGMGITALVVVIGCAVAWGLPPKKDSSDSKE